MAGRPIHTFEVVRTEQLTPHLIRLVLGERDQLDNPNVELIPKDTRGTPDGAKQAARDAVKEGAELIPGLAEAVPEATNGGKTYEFQLRDGLQFSDGSRYLFVAKTAGRRAAGAARWLMDDQGSSGGRAAVSQAWR